LEDRERPGAYHRVGFTKVADAEPVFIETTRPELIPACVALVAHPDDQRYQPLFGSKVKVPLFGSEIPVVAHRLAQPEKGSGIAMICTFGDVTDVTWWRELNLPVRTVIGRDGRFTAETPEWLSDPSFYAELAGKTAHSAREAIVAKLRETGDLDGEPTPTQRKANFFEKGDKPLEIVTSRQWYIRNGGRPFTRKGSTTDLKQELLARGAELGFHPDFMRVRYENWVGGLAGDWLISRQRFFGVAIPVWYPVLDSGETDFANPIVPTEDQLPVDPTSQAPAGFEESQRGVPGGFVGDADVMDTWATSSLTPQIVSGWERDEDLFRRIYPMDLRPQGQDIIRTWLFSTMVRSHLEGDCLPWKHTSISGWILDPDRKKMSKSKGNVVTPMGLLEQHGSDAVRYWAASARLGTDAAFDEGMMKIGRRLATKVLNAAKFVLDINTGASGPEISLDPARVTVPLDRAMLAGLADVVDKATRALEGYDHTRALELAESYFWTFCDDYLELVKERAYSDTPEAASARAALAIALDVMLRLLAPVLPFATEEVWSWWREGSIHRSPWPLAEPLRAMAGGANPDGLAAAGHALAALRKLKSLAKVTMKTPILEAAIAAPAESLALIEAALDDIRAAGKVTGPLALGAAPAGYDVTVQGGITVPSHLLGEPPARQPR
ncbi:MAG: valine--tRNA ligase, partial [Promicromonosporaceae bacterium]|nr:valine--tRNA ligase [Promicromonosporaceae bacterium]